MDRFMIAENPMVDPEKRPIYILHTQEPAMIIEVHHESFAYGDEKMHFTGNYENIEGDIETITFTIGALLICEPELSEELKSRVNKVLTKAWHWYVSYMNWEDKNIADN